MVLTALYEFNRNDLGAHWRQVRHLGALDPAPAVVFCCIHSTRCVDGLLGE
jgi:hypothetical protein